MPTNTITIVLFLLLSLLLYFIRKHMFLSVIIRVCKFRFSLPHQLIILSPTT